jgi:ABC-2 type transport system permease protein
MNKISYIIRREYLTRVRKKTFWILTFLLPVLYMMLIGITVFVQTRTGNDQQYIYITDPNHYFDTLQNEGNLSFVYLQEKQPEIEKMVLNNESYYLLKIPMGLDIDNPQGISMIYGKRSSNKVINSVNSIITERIRDLRIKKLGFEKKVIDQLNPIIKINIQKLGPAGYQKDDTDLKSAIAFIAGLLNYFFIFIYGSLVLRGVQEEKSSRIVEIIVSSVRPFELMLGKIIGIALVGLSQFLLWIILVIILSTIGFSLPNFAPGEGDMEIGKLISMVYSINLPFVLGIFMFYFIGGYLLYSSLFASIAAAVDNQSDIQQFMLPLSLPLILAFIFMQPVVEAPNSSLAFWFSIIPFTSPITMMCRIMFDIPVWELVLSMILLVGGFLGTTWISSRIYRIGILNYGNKVTYKDLWKWIGYK